MVSNSIDVKMATLEHVLARVLHLENEIAYIKGEVTNCQDELFACKSEISSCKQELHETRAQFDELDRERASLVEYMRQGRELESDGTRCPCEMKWHEVTVIAHRLKIVEEKCSLTSENIERLRNLRQFLRTSMQKSEKISKEMMQTPHIQRRGDNPPADLVLYAKEPSIDDYI